MGITDKNIRETYDAGIALFGNSRNFRNPWELLRNNGDTTMTKTHVAGVAMFGNI